MQAGSARASDGRRASDVRRASGGDGGVRRHTRFVSGVPGGSCARGALDGVDAGRCCAGRYGHCRGADDASGARHLYADGSNDETGVPTGRLHADARN